MLRRMVTLLWAASAAKASAIDPATLRPAPPRFIVRFGDPLGGLSAGARRNLARSLSLDRNGRRRRRWLPFRIAHQPMGLWETRHVCGPTAFPVSRRQISATKP